MKKLVFVLVALVYLVSAQGYWELVGFEGENVKSVAQHPQDTTIMLISIVDSIYRSTDGGYSWSSVTNFSGLPVNYLTFNPSNGDTAYALVGAGSYSDGIYWSTDAGNTWDILDWFVIPLCMIIPDYPTSFMLIGCESTGIFKSEDGGNSWEPWNEGLADSHIYVLDYSNPFDSHPIFFAGTAKGLFYWDINLNQWSQANGIAINVRVSSISHNKLAGLGFATVTGGSWSDGIYKSTDFGQNWQAVDYWSYSSCVLMNPMWHNYPDDTFSIFAGDSGLGVKQSTNGGVNWQEINTGLGNLYVNCLSYHPSDTLRLFCATQGGLYRYMPDVGVNENLITVPKNIIEIPLTILLANEPIPIKYCTIGNSPIREMELKIFDSAGRKIRADKINGNTTFLNPLRETGIYFIVSSEKEYYCRKKLIVID